MTDVEIGLSGLAILIALIAVGAIIVQIGR